MRGKKNGISGISLYVVIYNLFYKNLKLKNL